MNNSRFYPFHPNFKWFHTLYSTSIDSIIFWSNQIFVCVSNMLTCSSFEKFVRKIHEWLCWLGTKEKRRMKTQSEYCVYRFIINKLFWFNSIIAASSMIHSNSTWNLSHTSESSWFMVQFCNRVFNAVITHTNLMDFRHAPNTYLFMFILIEHLSPSQSQKSRTK